MIIRTRWIVLGGLLLALSAAAVEPGIKIQLVGGTLVGSKGGGRLNLTAPDNLSFQYGQTTVQIPYPKVNTVEYGQSVSRRYVEAVVLSPIFLLAKSRKHFVTLGYVDPDGKQQALIFRVDKGDVRTVLAALEARTGRRVQYQDQEARKAGK